ncbi:MAG: aldolase/citrate lyase family protein [Hyphomicrobiaceae bacterium]|nr:aldolase/citrate lyase family protein [Hyphomicrobiaceae bacterium]
MKPNKMKEKFAVNAPAFGLSVMIPSPQMVEMAGGLGFDWVLIDCEHGAISLESVELMIMAAEAVDITPIVRPPTKSPREIMAVMDIGAMGVQVPHVNTADDARNAVAAVKYHPTGNRSMAAGIRAQGYGLGSSSEDYVETANRETLACVQLEDPEAIENADEILKVDGIDVFFIGPSDLSQAMGHPGNARAPEVAQAIDETLAKIVAAGHTPGMPGTTENLPDILAKGARYIYAHVPRLLKAAAADYFDAAKGVQK